jgi:valyl-tRNA synthetase
LYIQTTQQSNYTNIEGILKKQINADTIQYVTDAVANTIVVAIEAEKFFIEAEKELDTVSLKAELEKDLTYQKGFLESVLKKLNNEKFVANAKPDIIAAEQKKKADAEARIKTIEESLHSLQ